MAIELVIKIDESKLWSLKNEPIKENFNIYELASYIDKGIPLPKSHGRLIDADLFVWEHPLAFVRDVINDAPTIIVADKESDEVCR